MNKLSQKIAVHVTYLIDHAFSAMLPGFNWQATVSLRVYTSETHGIGGVNSSLFHMLLSKVA